MALNMEAIGKKIGPMTKSYDWKDVVLYALGVGAGFDEMDYVYERHLKVLPSFAMTAAFDFLGMVGTLSHVNPAGALHGEQDLIFHNPIPTTGTMTTEGRILHYYDKGPKGALVVAESTTRHSNGKVLFTSLATLFGRLDGGFGGAEGPQTTVAIYPERKADDSVAASPSPDQPLIYRLSGDPFPLHVDPAFARMAGFERPIMHGLCTHGFACRALIARLIPGRPEMARRMFCRFSHPLYPGDPIETHIWRTGEGKAVWRVMNAKTGDVVIDNGLFEYGAVPVQDIRFDGRVAVVTGGGSGLGRAYALELAKRGAKVVVNDFGGARDGSGEGSASPADGVVAEIRTRGGEATADYHTVATPEGGAGIIRTALDAFGRLDILINNAGILRDRSLAKMEPEDWRTVLDVHLNGAYFVTRPAFAAMRGQGYGRVVMTTSAAGLYGNFGQTNYCAAKLGLVGFMNALKLEGAKYNVQVNAVAPMAASRLTADVLPADLLEKMQPEFVAPLVLYLSSDRCQESGHIYNAGMGYYNRAAIMTGPGIVAGNGGAFPSVEDIASRWDAILNMEGAKEYPQLTDMVHDLLDARPPGEGPIKTKTGDHEGSGVKAAFDRMAHACDPDSAAGVEAVFQFILSGTDGGSWYAEVRDGRCRIETGVHADARCTISMETTDFLDLVERKRTAVQSYTSGKLKIEGDLMQARLLERLFKF